jgi:hypothetical protein
VMDGPVSLLGISRRFALQLVAQTNSSWILTRRRGPKAPSHDAAVPDSISMYRSGPDRPRPFVDAPWDSDDCPSLTTTVYRVRALSGARFC